MAKKEPKTEIRFERRKDPAMPGEVFFRCFLVDEDGNEVEPIGTLPVDEDEVSQMGHEAIEVMVQAYAERRIREKNAQRENQLAKKQESK